MKLSTNDLTQIPGVGSSIAHDLLGIGIFEIHDLDDKDPEELYLQLCEQKGMPVDRCMLYVFRCAVYFATVNPHDPELLKWWNWKDEKHRTKDAEYFRVAAKNSDFNVWPR